MSDMRSDIISIYMYSCSLQLLAYFSFGVALQAIDTGTGFPFVNNEALIKNFAVLEQSNNPDDLPPDFTVCSSTTTMAFSSYIHPFQLLHSNGKPWISVGFVMPMQKSKKNHRMVFFVSFTHNLSDLSYNECVLFR